MRPTFLEFFGEENFWNKYKFFFKMYIIFISTLNGILLDFLIW